MSASLAGRLREGPAALGTLLTTASTEVAEVAAAAGFEWLFLDLEHGALDVGAARILLQVVQPRTFAAIRLPDQSDTAIKQALDIGADAIIVPMVNSAAQAQAVVQAAKYPPMGRRSVGIARAHGYGTRFADYVANANATTSVIVQVEHREAVNNLDDILGIPGIDGVFIGPYDLSGSFGCLGEVANEQVQAAVTTTFQACKARKIPVGIFAMTAEAGRQALAQGYDFVAVGIDLAVLATALAGLAQLVRDG